MGAALDGSRSAREAPVDEGQRGFADRDGYSGSSASFIGYTRPGGSVAGDGYAYPHGAEEDDRVSLQELAQPWRVFRDGLQSGGHLSIRVGPVVGKVTDTTAIILLEVDYPGGDVTLSIARALEGRPPAEKSRRAVWAPDPPLAGWELDTVEFAARGSVSMCQVMEPCKPYSFTLEGLDPETAYFVFIGGVRKEDLQRRVARFRTLPERVDSLRLLAVCGHTPLRRDVAEESPWLCLHELQREGPEVQLVLHLGSTVHSLPAAQRAVQEMRDHSSFRVGIRREMERKAKDAMRAAFVAAWGKQEGLRQTLAGVGSHLPIFAPIVDLHRLLLRPPAETNESPEERRTLLRLVLDIAREYQRALWQPRRGGSNHVLVDVGSSSELGRGIHHFQEFWEEAGPVGDLYAEEWHFHRYGQICVLALDTKGGLLSSCGLTGKAVPLGEAARRPLLSMRQQDMLGQVLKDGMARVIILAADIPFFWERKTTEVLNDTVHAFRASMMSHVSAPSLATTSTLTPQRTRVSSTHGNSHATPPEVTNRTPLEGTNRSDLPLLPSAGDEFAVLGWRAHEEELVTLLESLFEWKNARFPDREVVLLSAGPQCGTTGDVRDHKLGLSIPIVLTGPVHGPTAPDVHEWALHGHLSPRFSWAYRKPTRHCNFCTLDVDLSSNDTGLGKPTIDIDLVRIPAPEKPQ